MPLAQQNPQSVRGQGLAAPRDSDWSLPAIPSTEGRAFCSAGAGPLPHHSPGGESVGGTGSKTEGLLVHPGEWLAAGLVPVRSRREDISLLHAMFCLTLGVRKPEAS